MKCRAGLAFTFSLLISVGTLTRHASCVTHVSGFVDTDTLWRASESPYIVGPSVIVTDSATLEIQPGVTVSFAPDCILSIASGTLVAIGTVESNILFIADSPIAGEDSNRWSEISFGDAAVDAIFDVDGSYLDGCVLKHAVIEGAGHSGDAAIDISSCAPLLDHCVVRDNAKAGIRADGAEGLIIRNTSVLSNGLGGIELISCLSPVLDDLSICGNQRPSSNVGGAGILFFGSPSGRLVNSLVDHNVSYKNGGGVHIHRSDNVVLSNNTISANSGDHGGIHCYRSGNLSITDSKIAGNEGDVVGGIWIQDCTSSQLVDNWITGNSSHGTAGGMAIDGCNGVSITGGGISGNRIGVTGGAGIRVAAGSANVVLSASSESATRVTGNLGSYQVYNACLYQNTTDPLGAGNVDARHTWWGTTNASEIADGIFDLFDSSSYGLVFADQAATNDPGYPPSAPFLVSSMAVTPEQRAALEWSGVPGDYYTVMRTHDLLDPRWQPIYRFHFTTEPSCVMTVGVSSAQSTFYCVTLGDAFVRTGLCAEAIYYFPFITDIPQNYGTAYIAPTVYGATWHAEENGDGRFYFDGQPTASGTPIEDHDLVWMGTRLPGFPMGDFTIAASFAASNDNAVIGSGADEQWSKEWFLSRNMLCWAHQKGTSSGGRNKEFVEVTWNGVPYGVDTTVAITRSGSNVVTYVNGQEIPHSLTNYTFTGFYVRTPLPPHVLPSDTLPVYSYGMMIGNTEWGSPSQNWRPFQGYIDNVAIFDRVLDNNEIEILYAELRDEGSSN